MLDKRIKKVPLKSIDPNMLVKLIALKTKTGLNVSVYEIPNGPIKILLHKGKKIQAAKVNSTFAEDLHELYRIESHKKLIELVELANEYKSKGE